jgi:hypothetical protein
MGTAAADSTVTVSPDITTSPFATAGSCRTGL